MSTLGHRPTLEDVIRILDACTVSSAEDISYGNNVWKFHLTFDPKNMYAPVEGWSDGLPTPTWLIEEVLVQLRAWRSQCTKEAQWVSKEAQMESSIDTLMTHWTEELKKVAKEIPETLHTRLRKSQLAHTILRLQELKERREAGGVYSKTESRREKARKSWMDDETEAPKREEEQKRQQQTWDYAGFTRAGYRSATEEEIKKRWQKFAEDFQKQSGDTFFGADWAWTEQPRQKANPKPSGKRTWYTILGVEVGASKTEITRAYRKLASKYHPDRYKESDGHTKMAEINTARDEGLAGLT